MATPSHMRHVYLASQSEAAILARSLQQCYDWLFSYFWELTRREEGKPLQVTAAEYKKRDRSLRGLVFDNHREVEAEHKANTLLAQ